MDFAKLMAEVNDFVWGPIMLAFWWVQEFFLPLG